MELAVFARRLGLEVSRPTVAQRLAQFERERLVVRRGRRLVARVDVA